MFFYTDDRRHIVDLFQEKAGLDFNPPKKMRPGPNPDMLPEFAGGKLDDGFIQKLSSMNESIKRGHELSREHNFDKDLQESRGKMVSFNGMPAGRGLEAPRYEELSEGFRERFRVSGNSLATLAEAGLLYTFHKPDPPDRRQKYDPDYEYPFYNITADDIVDDGRIFMIERVFRNLEHELDKIARDNGAPYRLQELIAELLIP